jgi:ADP-heptose:LPS heptosyltransferase
MDISAKFPVPEADLDVLSRFFAEFLDENRHAEFRRIERQFGALREQGATVSGYPVIRPRDCAAITMLLESAFNMSEKELRPFGPEVQSRGLAPELRHPEIIERFERLIAGFHEFCRKTYPGEATAILILHCRVLLLMGQNARVVEMASPLALRPYAVENSLLHNAKLIELLGQAHIRMGTIGELPISFLAFGVWLVAQRGDISPVKAAIRMAPFVNFDSKRHSDGYRVRLVHWSSSRYLATRRTTNGFLGVSWFLLARLLHLFILSMGYRLLARGPTWTHAPFSLRMNRGGPILVTRAMGGIGDLLMMQPGLEALARRRRRPIDFAIPRKFFAIFQNDPNVRLVDIDGPPIDISQYSRFINLTLCPAGRYESRYRPYVKRGRVEIFASTMGIGQGALRRQGWRINRSNSAEEERFCDRFLAEKGLGSRPLIGIQPYSRDSYKDHPAIDRVIAALAQDHDILFFHHLSDGLPQGAGFADTAGVALTNSLALVSRLDAMVSVDSAFLHAAAAYDVPVIAMFGPTDARTFTRHHRHITILWKPETFGCVPCWRNEDLPCHVTKTTSASPCLAAITPEEVLAAVRDAIGPRR